VTRRIWQELVLVELDKRSLEPSRLAPPQRAVNPLEDLAGRIVIAIIDERVGDERPDTELCAMLTLKGGRGRVAVQARPQEPGARSSASAPSQASGGGREKRVAQQSR
jgi:hypothetical protein